MDSMIGIIFTVLIAMTSGAVTGIITVVSVHTDMKWIKQIVADHKERLNSHSTRINKLERENICSIK